MVCMLLAAPDLSAPVTAGRGALPVVALLLAVAVAGSVVVSTDRIPALRPAPVPVPIGPVPRARAAGSGGTPAPDGALRDGAPRDGAPRDGAPRDGALPDGALPDGALRDGALPDGALPGRRSPGRRSPGRRSTGRRTLAVAPEHVARVGPCPPAGALPAAGRVLPDHDGRGHGVHADLDALTAVRPPGSAPAQVPGRACTTRPSTRVRSTSAWAISAAGWVNRSRSSTTRSARLPGSTEPASRSSWLT